MPLERWTSETQRLLVRYGQTMEQTATKVFKQGIIDRRTYLHLVKGFSGTDADVVETPAEEETTQPENPAI